jgi:hypothetical protein
MYTEMVLKKIEEIKRIYGNEPQCYLVACILSTNFKGEVWYDNNHCITEIDGNLYDKKGIVSPKKLENGNYLPLSMYGIEHEKALFDALIEKHGL